jgi:hypothetical protein
MKILKKSVQTYLLCVVFASQMFFAAASINAAQSDNITLEISASKPATSPNVAVVSELTTFNFKVTVYNTTTRAIEAKPPNVKEYIYSFSCPNGTINSAPPTATISTDKHSASLRSATLLPNAPLSATCTTKGKFMATLNVQMIFNDNSSLSDSFSIELDIVDATVTVYAKKPDKVVTIRDPKTNEDIHYYIKMRDILTPYGDYIGHSFWRCLIDESISNILQEKEKNISGKKFGLYPRNGLDINIVKADDKVPGTVIQEKDNHVYSASKSYSITVDKAKKLITKTIELNESTTLEYNIAANNGVNNCTSLSVKMCNDAGGASPEGKGRVGFRIYRSTGNILTFPNSIPNPYSHATQLNGL